MPTPKCSCAISTLFFVSISKQRAGHTCKTVTSITTVTVYPGALCGQRKLGVHTTATDHPNNRTQERVTGKILPGFHCMHVSKMAWEEAKGEEPRNIFSHWGNETSSFSRNSLWCQTNWSMPSYKYHRCDSLIFIIQYSKNINYLILAKILLGSGNTKMNKT